MSRSTPDLAQRRWTTYAPLGLALLLAVGLRFSDVTRPIQDVFSWREASTAMMADNYWLRNPNIFFPEVSWVGPGPGYQGRELPIIAWLTSRLYAVAGWHDWFGRAVAAAFGVAGVLALHRLVERTWTGREADLAALVMAVLPGAVLIDRCFLPDPAMLALVTAGCWMYVAWLDQGGRWRLAVAAALLALGIMAKPPGAAILAPVAYATFHAVRRDAWPGRRWLELAVAAAIMVGAAAAYFSWAVYLGRSVPPYHVAGSGYIWDDLAEFVRARFYFREANFHVSWFLTGPLAVLTAIGLLIRPPGTPDRPRYLMHAWLVGAVGVYIGAADEIVTNPWNFLIFATPGAAFAAVALSRVTAGPDEGRLSQRAAHWAVAGTSLAVILWAANLNYWTSEPKHRVGRELGLALQSATQPGDLVIAVGPEVGNPQPIYYSRRRGWVFPAGGGERDWSLLLEDDAAIRELQELQAQGADYFGMAVGATDSQGRTMAEDNQGLIAYLDSHAARVADNEQFRIWKLQPAR